MMNQVFTLLPDDRPITALIVIEQLNKCPKGFSAVSRTYDQDSDADLWREGGFFGRKCTRYLCISKTEGSRDRVIEAVSIIGEKEQPSEGFTVLSVTYDSGQKAWRKKRLCYKLGHASSSSSAVTDIIVLSRTKKPPEEFTLCGDLNGLTLCHKIGRVSTNPLIPYNLGPALPPKSPALSPGPEYMNTPPMVPSTPNQSRDYVLLRRAPLPPPKTNNPYATISGLTGMEGVPFILNPTFPFLAESSRALPRFRPKTSSEIDAEFNYDFRTERAT